jgi:uncharacterized RDD family membrane protein YckC
MESRRERYGRYSDRELEQLLAARTEGLSPDDREALAEEAGMRGLPIGRLAATLVRAPASPLDVWHYPKAGIGARFLASIIDSVVGIFMPIMASVIGIASAHGKMNPVNVVLLISSIVWAIYYNFTKDGHDEGRSIGKRAMGLRVVNIKTNKPCSMGESSLRAVMLMVLNMVPLVGGLIEPLAILIQRDGRRVGDKVAGTQVIDTRLYDP